jgi:hypothetical protein
VKGALVPLELVQRMGEPPLPSRATKRGGAVKDPVTILCIALALAGCSGGIGELPVDGGDDPEPGSDARACLDEIPASCPDCVTQNSGDAIVCQRYLRCFTTCNPSQPCGAMDGVCGVNVVGGGTAPYAAALATYRCACP